MLLIFSNINNLRIVNDNLCINDVIDIYILINSYLLVEFSESSENKDLAPSNIKNRQLVTDEINRLQEQTHVMDR